MLCSDRVVTLPQIPYLAEWEGKGREGGRSIGRGGMRKEGEWEEEGGRSKGKGWRTASRGLTLPDFQRLDPEWIQQIGQ